MPNPCRSHPRNLNAGSHLQFRAAYAASARRAGPEIPIHDLDPLHCAPPGHEGARYRCVEEIEGQGIVHDPSRARCGRGPPIGTTIGIEPCVHLIGRTARAFRRDCDPDPDGAPSGGSRLGGYCGIRRSTPFGRYHVVNQSREEAR